MIINDLIGERLQDWSQDPILFLAETLPNLRPDAWQKLFLQLICKYPRVACRSGHGTGKSASVAWLIIWYLFTRYPAKITVTAPKAVQLEDVIWAEVALWRTRLPPLLRDNLMIHNDIIFVAGLQRENFAIARTARRETPEGLQGQHSKNQLAIADEASGVPDQIFDVIEGTMTTPGSKLVLVGNPTRIRGYFYAAFHKDKSRWKKLHISCTKAQMVDPSWIEYMKEKYGENHNVYKVRVLGDFPTDEEGAVIPYYLIEEACSRDVEEKEYYPVTWGLDVAWRGNDRSALAKRRGDKQLEKVRWWRGLSTLQLAEIVREEYEETRATTPARLPVGIYVDIVGVGPGVYDQLVAMGLPAIGVSVSEGASMKLLFERKRDELYFAMRTWFESQRVSLVDDDVDLVAELAMPQYTHLPSGKRKVESKQQMRARGEPSPDLSDAFMLTFAGGHDKLIYQHKRTISPKERNSYSYVQAGQTWLTL